MSTDTASTLRPNDLGEALEAILDAAGALLFTGGGTKLGWGTDPTGVDVVIETTAMTDLLSYDAADATVAVQAGMPLAQLQATLAEHDQWLAIDPPHVADGATVGGVFATNDAGPRRLAHGTVRDLVIGATYVLADGAVGRTGGFVIKNVAGYDMAKLLCGSLGTLALVAELVLRVDPRPQASVTLGIPADAATAARIGVALGGAPVEPVAVEWADDTVWLQFAGHPDAVRAQADATVALLRRQVAADLEADEVEDADAVWRRLTDGLAGADGQTVVRGACLPTQLPDAAQGCVDAAGHAGVDVEIQAHVLVGVLTARVVGDPGGHAAFVDAWRARLSQLGGHAMVRRTAAKAAGGVDVWGSPPSAMGLMRQVKQQLDPDGRCAPGRFVGGM
ncbi:MAG: FAD-binding protein [Actinobacteria bacterium]|nr:FAD-binding protein [Actinomycetota bacterium]